MATMKQGTIHAYICPIDVMNGQTARSIQGFGATPAKALADGKKQLTAEEEMFAFVRIGKAYKVKASYRVPLSDVLSLKTCELSDWTPDED